MVGVGGDAHTGHSLFDVTFANDHSHLSRLLLMAAILTAVFGLAVSSLVQKSPTFDEQGFIVRGLAYLRDPVEGGTRAIRVGHPPGLNAYNALLLAGDDTVQLPADDPSWQGTSFHRPAELFLWEIGNDVAHIMFMARVPTVWLGIVLIALLGRWAAEMSAGPLWAASRTISRRHVRNTAGLMAVLLAGFDPNLLAHMRLATTDFGLTATAALAGYALWRFGRAPAITTAVVGGIGLGLMLNTKFTAILFLPLFGLVLLLAILLIWLRALKAGQIIVLIFVYSLASFITLWLTSGFDYGPLPSELPMLPALAGRAVPLAHYLTQLLDIGGRLQVATPAFLLGEYSDSGWWYYFPVAFLLKTPLPTLLLMAGAVILVGRRLWRHRKTLKGADWLDVASLLIPAAGFFAIALTTEINLGYRHILPVLPFLFVLTAASWGSPVAFVAQPATDRRVAVSFVAWLGVGLIAALMAVSVWVHPHYLAFFNALAGGPNNGWRALVDSNLDWGQDLQALKPWMDENNVDRVWLSYFGEARPQYYGIDYDGLDSFPPRLMNPDARPFVPHDPAPGWYAISATNLQGVHFADREQFATFRARAPADKLGYSIFLFEVPARGAPANLLLDGVQADEIAPADFAQLGTNDFTMRWFDGSQALILPTDGRPTWLLASTDSPLTARFGEHLDGATAVGSTSPQPYTIWQLPRAQEASSVLTTFQRGESTVELLDATDIAQDGRQLAVTTAWRQRGVETPMKMFVHLLDENGAIVAQWDGFGAAWEGWRDGDILWQQHLLKVPVETRAGDYHLVAGLYDPDGLERWQLPDGTDQRQLSVVTIP